MLPANQMPGWPQNMNLTNWMLNDLEKTLPWLNQFSKHPNLHTSTHWAPGLETSHRSGFNIFHLSFYHFCAKKCDRAFHPAALQFMQGMLGYMIVISDYLVLITMDSVRKVRGSPEMQVPHPNQEELKIGLCMLRNKLCQVSDKPTLVLDIMSRYFAHILTSITRVWIKRLRQFHVHGLWI